MNAFNGEIGVLAVQDLEVGQEQSYSSNRDSLFDDGLPAEGIVGIVQLFRDRSHLERFFRLDHYR